MDNHVSSEPKEKFTPQEYLQLERSSEAKSEYLNGKIFAMAGASREHNLITVNALSEIHQQIMDTPCEVYSGDMRVNVSASGLYTYPDIVAVCDQPAFEDDHLDTLLNPQFILEVLSPSTESYDRGRKFSHYRSLESFSEYLLVSQTECRIEQFVLQTNGKWLYAEVTDPDGSITLSSIPCQLLLGNIYRKVHFETKSAGP